MSRRECVNGRTCGIDLCPLEDPGCILGPCSEYEDSGYRQPLPRPREVVRALLDEKVARFRQLKSSASGFRFGQGKEAAEECRRWRKEISRLKTELRSWGEDVE